ncbi:CTP synthase [bacterium]|nr:CTP synthase [bacterium]
MAKYIFVTGGVMSSLGKGIISSSIGLILKSMGYKVSMLKFDPYLNVDAGSMNPYQHGEVFVTKDGGEVDLDIGHYERFLSEDLSKANNVTSGSIYKTIIEKERKGDYLGQTIQVVPHLTDEIILRIKELLKKDNSEIIVVEIGGTVGDIESLPFLEAASELKNEEKDVYFFHVTYVPYLDITEELKTKPTQHSVKELRSIGIYPDILFLRGKKEIKESEKDKLFRYLGIPKERIISVIDLNSHYFVPELLLNSKIKEILEELFDEKREIDISNWKNFTSKLNRGGKIKKVGILGKYIELKDAYISLKEALIHSQVETNTKIETIWISSEDLKNLEKNINEVDGIIIPGGFGKRGIEGMIEGAKICRLSKKPLLGICLGLQIIIIEFFRNVVGLNDSNSTEFDEKTSNPIIDLLSSQRDIKFLGGTMHLGESELIIKENTKAYQIYKRIFTKERHRHRYTFNLSYLDILEKNGMLISGRSRDGEVEIIELKDHPFYIGVQFHPEFSSKPLSQHPLFSSFINSL